MAYEPRTYRRLVTGPGLVPFEVVVGETDLFIHARRDLTAEATTLVREARAAIAGYIDRVPRFGESFVPVEVSADAPPVVRQMAGAAHVANVGPMAAVAGAVAEYVARGLSDASPEVIVENGGDIYLVGERERVVSVWAGEGGAGGFGIRLRASQMPLGVATSSGTIGPSVSLGVADTATVIAASGALADAAASAVGNRVHSANDVGAALAVAQAIPGVLATVVTVAGAVGAWGPIELVPVASGGPSAG